MFLEIFREAWAALGRNPVRSLLTMTGISWGIVAVTLLLSYGSGFRNVLMYTFEVFGKGAVVCWRGTTSEQAGGERAGKAVRFEQEDADWVKAQSPLVKRVTLETVKFKGISHEERLSDTAIRGVYPEYGDMRNEVALEGRWISQEDIAERRRVAFLGAILRKKLFSGTPAIGEAVRINGVKFTVIGTMDTKFSDSNYFTSDDESAFIPYTAASDLWDARYASVMLFEPIAPNFEANAMQQVRAAVASRQRFSAGDKRAIQMFGRMEFKPIYDGITIGNQALLFFVGALTLGIGGIGVMNIMLVSVEERVKEIGLCRALWGKKITYSRAIFAGSAGDDFGRRRDRHAAFRRHYSRYRHPAVFGTRLRRRFRQGRYSSDVIVGHHDVVDSNFDCRGGDQLLVARDAGCQARSRRSVTLRVICRRQEN